MTSILIIEDKELIRESIANYLQDEGYMCITAKDRVQGIGIAIESKPDLILCDIKMPAMDGHEVLKDLRDDPRTLTIPFFPECNGR